MGERTGDGEGGPRQRNGGAQAGGAARPRASARPKGRGSHGREVQKRTGAEGGGEAVLVVTLAEVPVLDLGDAVVDVVGEDMPREARKGARGENREKGPHGR